MQRKLFLLVAFLAMVLTASAGQGGMYYKNFNVDAVVHKDNTWDVTETMDVVFSEPRHGIYRYIPINFTLMHPLHKGDKELTEFRYVANIYNVAVEGYDFTDGPGEDDNSNNYLIKIGSEDEEVTGLQHYVIHYKFEYPDDRLDYKDYFCHTILGTDMEDFIEHFSFKIKFDKKLPANVKDIIEVYSGAYGCTDNDLQVWGELKGNTLEGGVDSIASHNGITIKFDLPEGYYEGVSKVDDTPMKVCLGITLGFIIIVFFFIFKNKRSHITKQIEFYPPEGISSAEVGTIIDGSVDNIDLGSLIPWFAGKGYLKITEKEEKGTFGKKKYLEVEKIKNLPENAPKYQHSFMTMLFKEENVIRLDKMPERPEEAEKARTQLNGMYIGEKELTNTSLHWLWYIPMLLFASLALTFTSKIEFFDADSALMAILLYAGPLATDIVIKLWMASGSLMRKKSTKIILLIARVVIFLICYEFAKLILIGNDSFMDLNTLAILFIVSFVACDLADRFVYDTPYRIEMMGKLLGLKEFIETAEKPRLEALLLDDPAYFYKILPYALVLEVSDKWAKQFKDIPMEKPDWYETSTETVGAYGFASMMTHNLSSSVNNAITTVSHDSSSSSSSGGGFSGGGGGGGGGGSW